MIESFVKKTMLNHYHSGNASSPVSDSPLGSGPLDNQEVANKLSSIK